jgi:hypothetical protein
MNMDQEYTCSVTLMILGDDLCPGVVSKELSLTPSQSWENGEHQFYIRPDGTKRVFDSYYEWGGWKKFIQEEFKDEYLEEQLQYWCKELRGKKSNIDNLKSKGLYCALDIFICTETTASIIIAEELQKEISQLGFELRISFQTHGK